MLIEFKITNFGPFREENLFSMVASNYDKTTLENKNVVKNKKFDVRLLKSAAIFGSNASGKTQLLNAISFMKYFVVRGGKSKSDQLDIPRFRLDDHSESSPSSFVVVFLKNDKIFEYGFVLGKDKVIKEWLDVWITNRRTSIFFREDSNLKSNPLYFKIGKIIQKAKQVKDWNLFLTKAFEYDQPGNEIILEVSDWFDKLITISGVDSSGYEVFTYENLENTALRDKYIEFIRNADFCLEDVFVKKTKDNIILNEPDENEPEWVRRASHLMQQLRELMPESTVIELKTQHKRFNEDGTFDFVEFSHSDESQGTLKFIKLTGPLLDILANGGTLLIDELDTKLHPLLVEKIIEEFNSSEKNPNNAQLIFTSHNTSILDRLRRDQLWFAKKDRYGVAIIEPLSNFKNGPRKEENLEERYLDGRFGAIPFLGKFGSKASKILLDPKIAPITGR